jgi:hypothetical protein
MRLGWKTLMFLHKLHWKDFFFFWFLTFQLNSKYLWLEIKKFRLFSSSIFILNIRYREIFNISTQFPIFFIQNKCFLGYFQVAYSSETSSIVKFLTSQLKSKYLWFKIKNFKVIFKLHIFIKNIQYCEIFNISTQIQIFIVQNKFF